MKRTDQELADEIAVVLNCYGGSLSRTSIAKRSLSSTLRVLRVLRSDCRFEERLDESERTVWRLNR